MDGQTDRNNLLPPAALLDRLGDLGAGGSFTGRSLVYWRSRLPVAEMVMPGPVGRSPRPPADRSTAEHSAAISGDGPPGPDGQSARAHRWLLDWPEDPPGARYGATGQFHLNVVDDSEGPRVSIDRLRLPVGSLRWEGAPEDLEDLKQGRLRWVGAERLDSRAVIELSALSGALDFEPDASLRADLYRAFSEDEARTLSRRFLRKQFTRILLGRRPSQAFLCLDAAGALEWFLPELAAGRGLSQNRYHKYDIFYHSIYACDGVPEPDLVLRMAALCHDFGKVDTRRPIAGGEATFHNHEMVSTKHVANITRRFGFEPFVSKRVRFLVRNHMFHYTSEWTDRAVRRFMRRISPDLLQDLIRLRLADREGSGKRTALPRAIQDLQRHIDELRRAEAELKLRDLAISGHDLMELGMKPGPDMGRLLGLLLDRVKAEEIANNADSLRGAAQEWLQETAATGAR